MVSASVADNKNNSHRIRISSETGCNSESKKSSNDFGVEKMNPGRTATCEASVSGRVIAPRGGGSFPGSSVCAVLPPSGEIM